MVLLIYERAASLGVTPDAGLLPVEHHAPDSDGEHLRDATHSGLVSGQRANRHAQRFRHLPLREAGAEPELFQLGCAHGA